MKKIAIIGTVGVPANYGGFETFVENIIGENCSSEIEYVVYCSVKSYKYKFQVYKNAKLVYLPLKANGVQSVLYDILSLIHSAFICDEILILGVSGCGFLPIFRIFSSKRLIINIDGLEHRRNKWGKFTRKMLLFSERMAIRYGNVIIADNFGIKTYIKEFYNCDSVLIAYGGNHVLYNVSKSEEVDILRQYGLLNKNYFLSVCRIEPENNVHLILKAFKLAKKEIVFVGNWENSEYGKNLLLEYRNLDFIKLLSPIYDLKQLYVVRSNCCFYIHGHSAGGTNPSLVEAMFFKKTIFAFDVIYNRETTENKANYFSSVDSLLVLLEEGRQYSLNASNMFEIANRKYKWNIIAKQYEALY